MEAQPSSFQASVLQKAQDLRAAIQELQEHCLYDQSRWAAELLTGATLLAVASTMTKAWLHLDLWMCVTPGLADQDVSFESDSRTIQDTSSSSRRDADTYTLAKTYFQTKVSHIRQQRSSNSGS